MNFRVDNLQYCNWSRKIFEINHQAKLDAVHATICYHEDFDEVLTNIKKWNTYFKKNKDLIFQGKSSRDIVKAKLENKTDIFSSVIFPSKSVIILDGFAKPIGHF